MSSCCDRTKLRRARVVPLHESIHEKLVGREVRLATNEQRVAAKGKKVYLWPGDSEFWRWARVIQDKMGGRSRVGLREG